MLKIGARSAKLFLLPILFCAHAVGAKSYTQCELSAELHTIHNVTLDSVRTFVCIARTFSRLNTNLIGGELYGIFQINNKWCGRERAGGECGIKCISLLDDDLSDDVSCAQKIIAKVGTSAWRIEKTQGCLEELKNLAESCPNIVSNGGDNNENLHRDYCEHATQLIATYDISKAAALTWSCIAEQHHRTHALAASKTGNVNLKSATNDDDDEEAAACVAKHDVECSIKLQKRKGLATSGFHNWPEYREFCSDISGGEKCFGAADEIIIKSESDGIKLTAFEAAPTEKPRQFTTSTEISVIIEEEGADFVTPTTEAQMTTEFLAKTLEMPTSSEEDMMIGGYSKVRLMSAEISEKVPSVDKAAKCEFVRHFAESGRISKEMVATLICIAEHESGLNASLVMSHGGRSTFGLFQIDNENYCNTNEKINECDILCAHLTDDQYDNDLECATYIRDKIGFDYWPSYARHCRRVNSTELLESCREHHTTTHRPYTVVNYALLKKKFNSAERLTTTTELAPESSTMPGVIKAEDGETTQATLSEGSNVIRQFNLCEFSQELYSNQNVSLNDLADFVCIADHASNMQLTNDDDGEEIGIFGLQRDSCDVCSISCSQLADKDLNDDVRCLLKIYKEKSLTYWNLTVTQCMPYGNKILQCLDEGKFETVDEEKDEKIFEPENVVEIQPPPADTTTERAEEEETTIREKEENLGDDAKLVLHNTLNSLLKLLAENVTYDNETARHASAENSLEKSEEDTAALELRLHDALKNILRMLDEDEASLKTTVADDQQSVESTTEMQQDELTTISLINLKFLRDETATEGGDELLTTTILDEQILPSTPAPEALVGDDNDKEESEIVNSFALTTTTEPLYYTSIREIIEDFQKFQERNLVKRKTTQYPESDDDWITTEESADEATDSSDIDEILLPPHTPSVGVIDKCFLTDYMRESRKIPNDLIPTFVCIAEHESELNVSLVRSDGGKNRYMRYGLFQIDDMDYCSTNEKINKCDVHCAHLNDDQFDNDMECAMEIYKDEGFKYWPSYSHRCANVDVHSLDRCRQVLSTTSHRPFTPFDREAALQNYFTTTVPTTTTTAPTSTTVFVPKFNYTDDESRFVVRRFDLCELATEAYKFNFSVDVIPDLLCVADLMSQFKIRGPLADDEQFGIFAIDREYCEEGGICGITCTDLIDDDIRDDLECFSKIYELNQTSAWYLSSEKCKNYSTGLLNCVDNDLFQTTLEPNATEITPWKGFYVVTEPIPVATKKAEKKHTTGAYYDNGVYTSIEILRSTKFPLKPNYFEDEEFPFQPSTTTTSLPPTTTATVAILPSSTEKVVTLSTLLEPPHFREIEEEEEAETTTIIPDESTTVSEIESAITTNITEEDLKRVSEIILSPDQILFLPKENFPSEIEEELRSAEVSDETTLETTTEERDKVEQESGDEATTTERFSNDYLKILSLDQWLLPPKDDENVGAEEVSTESHEEFLIVVKDSSVNSEEITTPMSPPTISSTTLREVVHSSTEQQVQKITTEATTTATTQKMEEEEITTFEAPVESTTTTTTTTTTTASSAPMFRRKTTPIRAQATNVAFKSLVQGDVNNRRRTTPFRGRSTTATAVVKKDETTSESHETTSENPLQHTDERNMKNSATISSEEETTTISSKIIETLATTGTSARFPQVILNDKNLKDQVETIIKAHSSHADSTNGTTPLVFNIFNFNIGGQNHDVKYAIHGSDEKKLQSP